MKNKHLVIVSYDGVFSYYTGVGTVIKNTIDILYDMDFIENLKISIAGISLDKNGKTFDVHTYEKTKALVNKYGGTIIALANDTVGYSENDLWRDPINWKVACNSLVTSLNLILDKDDDNIIILHDTVFLYFEIAKRQISNELRETIKSFYIPHSSGLNHTFTKESWNRERIRFEKECFSAIENNPSSKVIAIGKSFSEHLRHCYGITFGKDDYLPNGLIFENYDASICLHSNYNDIKKYAPVLQKHNKIIFSWGRLSQAKGFYELLEAWNKIQSMFPNHYLVIQAPMSCVVEEEYFMRFLEKKNSTPRVIHINKFMPIIWQTFLRYDKIDAVCFASTMDPNPFAPIEAKLFNKDMDYVIVASFKDGIKDSFEDGECISVIDPCDSDEFAGKLKDAIITLPEKRREMAERNFQTVHLFNYRKNIMDFLKTNNIII